MGKMAPASELRAKVYCTPAELAKILPFGQEYWARMFDESKVDGFRREGPKGRREILLESAKRHLRETYPHNSDQRPRKPTPGEAGILEFRKRRRERRQ